MSTALSTKSTLVICHYQPRSCDRHALHRQSRLRFYRCPKSLLKKVEHEVKEQHGMSFSVGVETELYLTASVELTAPVRDVVSYCSTACLRTPKKLKLDRSDRIVTRGRLGFVLNSVETDPKSELTVVEIVWVGPSALKNVIDIWQVITFFFDLSFIICGASSSTKRLSKH